VHESSGGFSVVKSKAIEAYSKALRDRRYRKLAEYKIDMIKNKDKYMQ